MLEPSSYLDLMADVARAIAEESDNNSEAEVDGG